MATMYELKSTARRLAYLGEVSKVMAALANEFGADHPLPSRVAIQHIIDERSRVKFSRQPSERRTA